MRKNTVYPIPRTSLLLLLITVALAVAPHFVRLPLWISVVALVCLGWRIQVFRERWVFPSRIVRFFMVLAGLVGTFLFYGTILGPDAGVTLLILAYLFKLLEMYKERDAFLIVILSYFVIATNYLFTTSLLSSAYALVVVLLITASLVGLNQTRKEVKPKRTLSIAGKLFVQALPVMVVLFIFVPRVSPIWALNINNSHAKTGLSDSITPGDISSLSKSSALAFTVEFLGEKPHQKELYWRGITFVDFDGRTWRRDGLDGFDAGEVVDKTDVTSQPEEFRYRVIMEPNYRHWLFSLPYSVVSLNNVKQTQYLVQTRKEPVASLLSYDVISNPRYTYQEKGLSAPIRERSLALPSTDPRAKRKAERLLLEVNGDKRAYAESVLGWFNKDDFVYTLKPPVLNVNVVDSFLFSTKQGFCAHYAGAFVFMMRAAGIPARMVGGYQGGEYHEAGHLMVKQYHAHAWAEIWLENQGWIRVDPTAAVAPERVLSGPGEATTDDSFSTESPLSPLLFRNNAFVRSLRSKIEYVDFLWSRWVVGYNKSTQTQFLSRWIENITPQKMVTVMLATLGGVMVVLALYILVERGKKKLDPIDKLYLRFCEKLADRGVERRNGEGVWAFYRRAVARFPDQSAALLRITQMYDDLRYGNDGVGTENRENNHDVGGTLLRRKKELQLEIRRLRLKV